MHRYKLALIPLALAAFSATTASAQSFDWSGPYVGLNAGGLTDGRIRFDETTGELPNNTNALDQGLRPVETDLDTSGFIGGAQIGYNRQFEGSGASFVLGVEADIAYVDSDETETLSNTTLIGPLGTPSTVPVTRINEYSGGLDYLGTVRARAGVAFDRLLVYGTGGMAYGRVKREVIFYGPNAPTEPYFAGSEADVQTGWTAGAGVEYALGSDTMFNVFNSQAVTLRAEYLHYDLGDTELDYPGVNGGATIGGYTSRVSTKGDLVRAGLNFKF